MSDVVPALEVLRRLDHRALLNVRGEFSVTELEDARSEFYVRLLEGRVGWHGQGSLVSWARTVVRFMALQLRERCWREVLEPGPSQQVAPAALDLSAERHLLRRLVGQLTPLQRGTIEPWLVGFTCPELAALQGLEPRTVERRLQHARERIQTLATAPRFMETTT